MGLFVDLVVLSLLIDFIVDFVVLSLEIDYVVREFVVYCVI